MKQRHGSELDKLEKQLKNLQDADAGDMLNDLVDK